MFRAINLMTSRPYSLDMAFDTNSEIGQILLYLFIDVILYGVIFAYD